MSKHRITAAERMAAAIAAGRIAIGAGLLAAPQLAAGGWIGEDAGRSGAQVLARGLGGRDLALGIGALSALRRRRSMRGWIEAGMLADLGDTAATLIAGRALPPSGRFGVLALAAGAAAAGAALAPRLG